MSAALISYHTVLHAGTECVVLFQPEKSWSGLGNLEMLLILMFLCSLCMSACVKTISYICIGRPVNRAGTPCTKA